MREENTLVLAALLNLEPTGGLEDQFPIGAPLRSNAEAIPNNRCLAALPNKGGVLELIRAYGDGVDHASSG